MYSNKSELFNATMQLTEIVQNEPIFGQQDFGYCIIPNFLDYRIYICLALFEYWYGIFRLILCLAEERKRQILVEAFISITPSQKVIETWCCWLGIGRIVCKVWVRIPSRSLLCPWARNFALNHEYWLVPGTYLGTIW